MKTERFVSPSCCGGTTIIYKLSNCLNKSHIPILVKFGFIEHSNFTSAGILYMNNNNLIINCPFGSNKLSVKYKNSKNISNLYLDELDKILQQM